MQRSNEKIFEEMAPSVSIANKAISNWHKKHGRIWIIKHDWISQMARISENRKLWRKILKS